MQARYSSYIKEEQRRDTPTLRKEYFLLYAQYVHFMRGLPDAFKEKGHGRGRTITSPIR
jgi:hypothetical protein